MDPEEEAALDKAEFCLLLGIAPSEYDRLTDTEVNAFIAKHNELRRKS